jgi:hypothetical protein
MPRRDPLDLFLDSIADANSTGAAMPETSYYPAISLALSAVGDTLSPKVLCLQHPSGGTGIPDFGLFERTLFARGDAPAWRGGTMPGRGVVEAKGLTQNITTLLSSRQVRTDYLPVYGLVLATNLRQWRLVDASGVRESLDLAANTAAFWTLARGRRPDALRQQFSDFLQRCLLWRAPLSRPQDVAFFLASYARDALIRVEEKADLPGLRTLRSGLERSLGIAFDARDGEHLFRSTLVQTLFYGLFTAWAAHDHTRPFDWRAADYDLNLPVIRLLYNLIRAPQSLRPLGLESLLDSATTTLARVDRDAFFHSFDAAHAVQYFYEPFLEFFDPKLRKQLGVWYTPPEIVEYMVERVDRVLREELGRADGLADPDVWVLDPCCGTGSYVVQVLKRICTTLDGNGLGDLVAERLKQAAMTRIIGFEIMTAPLIIAHWQVNQLLRDAPLVGDERAAVYLTNSLTGWSEDAEQPAILGFDELLNERTGADTVKRHRRILVVIGNPPYNAYAGVAPVSEGNLIESYKVGLQARWGIGKFNLDDPFVRFFRVAEQRIAQTTGEGIVCMISNFSWLHRPSYVVMRERLFQGFDKIWIDNLNGDSRETGKMTPEGLPDPSIFSAPMNREGIRVGTAISLMVRKLGEAEGDASASFREFWGSNKRQDVLITLEDPDIDAGYVALRPNAANRFSLRPSSATPRTETWTSFHMMCRESPIPTLLEKRAGSLFGLNRETLEERMTAYFDPARTMEELRDIVPGLTQPMDGKDPARIRTRALHTAHERYDADRLVPLALRPFDSGWAYLAQTPGIWNRNRPELQHVMPDAGGFIVTRNAEVSRPYGFPTYWTSMYAADRAMDEHAYVIPVIENLSGAPRPNISPAVEAWLVEIGLPATIDSAWLVWRHALAMTYSPAWLSEANEAIRQNWPLIPLPDNAEILTESAALGEKVSALLDLDTPVAGVTSGRLRPELAVIAVASTVVGATRDWRLTSWGNRTAQGVTMPGRGRTDRRDWATAELACSERSDLLGETTHDVWMNSSSYWKNVPDSVWETHIGGYQVLKKWLSYRDTSIIGRALSEAEVTWVQGMVRRLAALKLLTPELNANFTACAECNAPLAVELVPGAA